MRGATAWTPDAVLVTIGRGLDDAEAWMRLAYVDALGAYGTRAAAYLPKLQQLLAGETDVSARRRLELAIEAIASQTPPPTLTPSPSPAPVPTPGPTAAPAIGTRPEPR